MSLFQVQDYKDSLKQKAEHLIIKGFPEKIVKLNELLETSHFQNRDLADVHQVPSYYKLFSYNIFTFALITFLLRFKVNGCFHIDMVSNIYYSDFF